MSRLKILFILLVIVTINGFSQKGKNGSKTVSTVNNKINEFTSLVSDALAGNNFINVAASSLNTNSRFTSTLTPGDLVMIIQMQGALMKLSPVPVWAPDSTYGRIYNNGYQSCGNYEFAQVKSVISSTIIELDCGLQFNYSVSGKTQVIRVPRYSSLNVTTTGTLTTDSWNGSVGGVLVAEVDGNTIVNGVISANGLGFRGGVAAPAGGFNNGNYAVTTLDYGAQKGEGIGSHRLNNSGHDTLGLQCMGAPANGGGGGNTNNCGGGGGANAGDINNWSGYGVLNSAYSSIFDYEYAGRGSVTSSGGGKGGYSTGTGSGNPALSSNGPNNTTAWGSYRRESRGGFGGRPLDYSTGKIFMGGGGGAGHMSNGQSNGTNACSGGNGGGIIYLLNYGTISGTGTITTNGANGNNAFGSVTFSQPTQGLDGAGGGGAGGTIILNSVGNVSSIIANANGGKGGNQVKSGLSSSETQGPGGGGGGGYIASNGGSFTQNVNGGIYGTTNSSNFSTFPMNGATSGNVGLNNQSITNSFALTTSGNQTICAGNSTNLTASISNPTAGILWYNSSLAGTAIASGTAYATPIYTAAGTYTLYAGSCPGSYRLPVVVTVNSSSISVNSQTICAGQSATLHVNESVTSYSWNNSATTQSIVVTPTVTTTYSVIGVSGSCTSQATATVFVNNNLNMLANSATICVGQTATLQASGALTYTWSTSANSNSIVVNPTITSTYTVYGESNACNGITTATVLVLNNPTLTVNSATICSGQSATLTANGALTYTWSNGSNSNQIFPTNTMTFSVVGADITGCVSSAQTATVLANPIPTITVNSATVCVGANALLTADGAASYTWNTGVTTNTLSVSPTSTAIYTVIGESAGCLSQATTSVFVINTPTITINSATICVGQTATLNATGVSSYTWSNGFNGSIQLLSPTQTTTYSATGNVSNCYATSNTASVNVISVFADFTTSADIVTLNSMVNLTNTSINANNYVWNFCDGTSSISTNTTALLNTVGNCCFTLTAINNSCTHSLVKCIEVINDANVVIPNVFTPNNDGKNDLYKVSFSGMKTITVNIFNRWGSLLFYKTYDGVTGTIDWNGSSTTNTPVSDGTYLYIVEYTDLKDVSKIEKGYLSLLRD